jgi:hypothetical protein
MTTSRMTSIHTQTLLVHPTRRCNGPGCDKPYAGIGRYRSASRQGRYCSHCSVLAQKVRTTAYRRTKASWQKQLRLNGFSLDDANARWLHKRLEATRQAGRRALNEWMGIRDEAGSADLKYQDSTPAPRHINVESCRRI